jgi:hypothetical protein
VSTFKYSNDTDSRQGLSLFEGETDQIIIYSSPDRYIKEIWINLSWEDEPDGTGPLGNLNVNNIPDEFTVSISIGNASIEMSATNPDDGEGMISTSLSINDDEINQYIEAQDEDYSASVEITLSNVGNYANPRLAGAEDTGNSYDYELIIVYAIPN